MTVQARARFKEGVEAFDKGKYEEARLSFLQAYTLKKHPSVLLNLAQSSAKSNHPLEAAKYFQQFLKEASTATPQQRKDAESGLNEVRQKLGRIDVVAPAGTEISLDDQGKVGTTPMEPLDVEPGQHTVKSPTQSATVIAVVGQKVEAKLGPTAAAPPVGPVATPAPTAGTDSTPPPEQLQVDGTIQPKSTKIWSRPEHMTPVVVGAVVGGVGLVSTLVFALFRADAKAKADSVNSQIVAAAAVRGIKTLGACKQVPEFAAACETLKDNNSKVDTNATIANVSAVVAVVGLLGGGAWYLFAPKHDAAQEPVTGRAPRSPVLTPYAGWGNGGLSLAGEF